jgi:hypothetical protein
MVHRKAVYQFGIVTGGGWDVSSRLDSVVNARMHAIKKTYVETFDNGPSGWMSWAAPLQPVRPEVHDGALVSRSPWGVDSNHAPPGAGYLHLPFILLTSYPPNFSGVYREVQAACGTNRFIEGGFSRDLRHAKIRARLKGGIHLRGAQLVLLARGNISRDKGGNIDWTKPNVVNQVLTAQPFVVTPDWSEQTITLIPDQKQWTQLGSHEDAGYGQGPIEDLLRDVNFDLIFILFPLDVRPLRPVRGDYHRLRPGRDYEVDRSRLPEGYVMLDEVRIEYP